MQENKEEKDINDVFSDILLSEEIAIDQAYEEGFSLGLQQENPEGYHLGYHRGAELGAEIGYYTGITEKYLQYYGASDSGQEKIITSLKNLKKLLDTFPRQNIKDIDILELINVIRAKYKKICTQMKLDAQYSERNSLSF
ncbi:hypothetical protein JTB14_002395 [Gonioctena quinquepunctata]|nr:hypothetical protein JTB14_002395 [Gonioctena quinquepunctata]